LTVFQRIEMSLPLVEIEKELAKDRMLSGTLAEISARGTELVARKIGCSHDLVDMVLWLMENAPEKCIKKGGNRYNIERYMRACEAHGVSFDYSNDDKSFFLDVTAKIGSEKAFLLQVVKHDKNSVVLSKEDILKIETELNVLHGDFRERGKAKPTWQQMTILPIVVIIKATAYNVGTTDQSCKTLANQTTQPFPNETLKL